MNNESKKVGSIGSSAPPASNDWIDCLKEMPDSDLTVLIHHPEEDEPVWMGYHDGENWRGIGGEIVLVSHWRDLPDPPARKIPRRWRRPLHIK